MGRSLGYARDDSDGYFDTIEINVFMNLLSVIDNRMQDVPPDAVPLAVRSARYADPEPLVLPVCLPVVSLP